jgi:DNA-binding NtrC family response regulator
VPVRPTATIEVALSDWENPAERRLLEGHNEVPAHAYAAEPAAAALTLLDAAGAMRPLEEIEADAIRFAIAHYGGHMSEVARRLRIGRSTLYRKLDALGLAALIAEAKRARGISVTPQE